MNTNCTAMIIRGWSITARDYAKLIESPYSNYAIVDDLYSDNPHFFFAKLYEYTAGATILDPEDIGTFEYPEIMNGRVLSEDYAMFRGLDELEDVPDAHLFLILQTI